MASLQIIQNLIDQIPALLQEVADLRPANTGTPVWQEPSYSIEDIQTLEAHLTNWASTTEATLKEELGRESAQTFRQTWNTRHRDLPYKKASSKNSWTPGNTSKPSSPLTRKSCKPNQPSPTSGPSYTPPSKTLPEDTSKPKTTTALSKPPPKSSRPISNPILPRRRVKEAHRRQYTNVPSRKLKYGL